MFSTASCIGQLSWLHIKQKPQALSDLQAFNDASRGPAGAVSMLASPIKYRFPVIMGSVITIATLLMEPFSQQVLQFPLRPLSVKDNATYPTTQFYAPAPSAVSNGPRFAGIDTNLNASIQAAIVNAIFDSPTGDTWICPLNSSCIWNTFATLGICSSCTDVTAETEKACPKGGSPLYNKGMADWTSGVVCNYTTPNNFTLQSHFYDSSAQMSFVTRINTTARTSTISDTGEIISFATLLLDWGHSLDIHECSLSWCAKVLHNATAQGPSFSVHIEEYALSPRGSWNKPGDVPYSIYEAESGFPTWLNSTFTVQSTNAQTLSNFLVSVLDTGSFIEYLLGDAGPSSTFSLGPAMLNSPSTPYMANSIATSLTNTFRNVTSDYVIHNLGDSSIQIQYIRVRWEWLAFPASIVLLGVILLLNTMIQSHRDKALVWKCSSLALLFHPLQGWETGEIARTSKKEMDKCAESMRGQLSQSDDAGLRIIKA